MRKQLAGEIDAPEMGRRRQELYSNTNAPIARISQVHDPAFLFFLGFRADQHKDFALHDFVAEDQQPAVGAHDHRFADLAKLAPFVATPQRLQLGFMEDALAATVPGFDQFSHGVIMEAGRNPVNCPKGQVFPVRYPNQTFAPTCASIRPALE